MKILQYCDNESMANLVNAGKYRNTEIPAFTNFIISTEIPAITTCIISEWYEQAV